MVFADEARSVIHAHRWLGQRAQLMLWSKRLSVIPSESPALQWALRVRDRMVAEDAVTSFKHKYMAAVIKFLQIPLKKKKSPASTNGRADPVQERKITSVDERKANAATRLSSCGADLLSKTDTITAFKKTARHKSAWIYRLPLRHHCRSRHRRRTEENPRMFPCTALPCV